MERPIFVKAPAKINLGLFVTEKREDGFHNIETIFYPAKICDELIFSYAPEFSFNCESKTVGSMEDNIVVKAVKLLEKITNQTFPISIQLNKKIPVGAGLGGGSSDAATTLKIINELYLTNLNYNELMALAIQLGSDVPFFLNPIVSFGKGRGEILEHVKINIEKPILIVNPGIHISTKWAYENIKPKHAPYNLKDLENESDLFGALRENVKNDFEIPVFEKYSEIKNIKEKMYEYGAEFSLMSGSGSTVFGIFNSLEKLEECKKSFPENYLCFISSL